ncbi:MAG TPA: glutamate mutase L [Ktedonobacteraceae bacterium]|nr:glutamate mutase L [Ktedonobacteraceae bacterium]
MNTQPYAEGGRTPANGSNPSLASSLLVADCGTVFTKVSLLGLVEGQYRLMARGEAPTTIAPPHEDITAGIIQAINVIEFITGRHFVSEGHIISPEQPIGDGVDIFIATISAGGPIRLVVLGAVDATMEGFVAQAVSGLYAETHSLPSPSFVAASVLTPVSVGAGSMPAPTMVGGPWTPERVALEWERQIERFRELQPHAAMIVGTADAPQGPTPLQEACQLLTSAARELNERHGASISAGVALNDVASRQIAVLYAGAPQYVEATRHMLQGVAEVTRVDPLVSQAQVGSTSIAAGGLYDRDVMQHLPGYARLHTWSTSAPVATATSLSSLVRFLAQHYAMNVTAVDIGGATTTLMLAGEAGEFIPKVNPGIGVGPGVGAILQKVGLQRITRWLPFDISEDELRQYVLNRMLHPHVLPTSQRDLQISQAFAREALILTVEAVKQNNFEWLDADLILATGGILSHAPKYGQAALMLLDALQPRGVTSLVLDRTMLISQLGAVATVAPVAAVQVNENDAVTHRLGTCVIPFGTMPKGEIAVRVGIEYMNGRQVTVDVMSGSIEVVPLRTNEQALLSLFPAPTVDVGLGPGERARAAEEIDGGLVGLIIDARGRPLDLPTNEKERQARLLQWMQAIGA